MPETNLSAPDLPRRATFGSVTYPAGGRYGPRLQRDCQIFTVDAGSAVVTIDGTVEIAVAAGEVLLLLPGRREYFAFARTEATRQGWVHLDYEKGPPSFAGIEASALRPRPAPLPLTRLIELGALIGDVDGTGLLARQLGAAALTALSGEAAAGAPFGRSLPPILLRALAFIRLNSHRPIDVAAIATASGTSTGHLGRLCRVWLGVGPAELLWAERVDHGIRHLKSTGLSIAAIAYLAGFQSPYHFSRRVRARTGQSPRDLRRRHWQDASE